MRNERNATFHQPAAGTLIYCEGADARHLRMRSDIWCPDQPAHVLAVAKNFRASFGAPRRQGTFVCRRRPSWQGGASLQTDGSKKLGEEGEDVGPATARSIARDGTERNGTA